MSNEEKYREALDAFRGELNSGADDKTALVALDCIDGALNEVACGTLPAIMYCISKFLYDLAKREDISFPKLVSGILFYGAMKDRPLGSLLDDEDDDDTEVETIVLSGENASKARDLIEELKGLDRKEKKCLN